MAEVRSLLEQNMRAVAKRVSEKGKDIFWRQCLIVHSLHFFKKRLNLKAQDIWTLNGKELWEEIQAKRNMILHADRPPIIEEEYLIEAL